MGKRKGASVLWVDDAGLLEDPCDGLLDGCTPGCPERDLLRAILQEAITGARCGDPETVAWIASDQTEATESGFWFVEVCSHLGLDPNAVRKAVAAMPPIGRWHYSPRPKRKPRELREAVAA